MDIRYCALITDESRSQIWAIDATLPRLMISKPFWWQEVRPVNEAAGEQLGAGLTTLNCFRILGGEATVGSRLYYALELPPDTSALKAGRWRAVDELESIEERDIAAEWLAQLSSITVPWYQPGWRAEALAWAEVQLRERGFLPLRTSEQVRSWERSSLWQFNTTAGRFFFKAVSAAFAGEPALTRQLAQWQPEQVAPIVALDEPHGWLILGEAGDKSLLREQDATRWQAALSCYAELQMALAPRTNELLALGLPDRRVEHLPAWIEALLANTGALTNSPAGLSADEIERLRAQRPSVQAACARLANCPIPA